ncbi:hypothetical protein I8751_01225 [Nostocaceae cyanobacterium CENA357]|uniref:Uncharacterized protein n=1 Tax=Atlanticothrix silvestris CENA357 TaxID=1725252 RepID=A0A8J7H2N9_9CYAN|nr:hypothetical protein [Atlanticothrix silvestris]MBH8551033.1 hypothetical protein [Atlanticothrix silvestris CENA357]
MSVVSGQWSVAKKAKSQASLVGGFADLRELALCVPVSGRRTFQEDL